jgi:methionyl-tRNA formyltransferase
MRVVFMGTPEFAVPSLRALTSRHEVLLVVTQPDKPSGRGRVPQPPAVKVEALQAGLPVIQTENANHPGVLAEIQEMRPQVIVVVAYGCILKRPLLDSALLAPVNLHASLLPKYRGVSPINRAIMDGESVTGVTTMRMDEGIDTGPILMQSRVEIGPRQTAGELSEILARVGAELLLETVEGMEAGTLAETPQDDSQATYAKKLKKSDGLVPWETEAGAIVNHVRGVTPWPGAVSYLNDEALKILEAERADYETPAGAVPGAVVAVGKGGPVIAAGGGCVTLLRVCPQGRRPMAGSAWARGRRDLVGGRFVSKT